MLEPGWRAVADHILDWLARRAQEQKELVLPRRHTTHVVTTTER